MVSCHFNQVQDLGSIRVPLVISTLQPIEGPCDLLENWLSHINSLLKSIQKPSIIIPKTVQKSHPIIKSPLQGAVEAAASGTFGSVSVALPPERSSTAARAPAGSRPPWGWRYRRRCGSPEG